MGTVRGFTGNWIDKLWEKSLRQDDPGEAIFSRLLGGGSLLVSDLGDVNP